MKKVFQLSILLVFLSACSNNEVTKVSDTTEKSNVISSQTKQSTRESSIASSTVSSAKEMQFDAGTLLTAVEQNDLTLVKDIVSSKSYNINEQNEKGETPLLIATHNNQVDIAKVLIDAGADVNKQDSIEDSAYLYAAAQGKTEILSYILQHATPNQTVYNRFGGNAIIPAAEKGHLENVKLLLKDGKVDINHQNDYGYTALIEAVALRDGSKVYQQIVSELLKNGADKTLKDNSGRTAEDYASQLGYETILKLLKQY